MLETLIILAALVGFFVMMVLAERERMRQREDSDEAL